MNKNYMKRYSDLIVIKEMYTKIKYQPSFTKATKTFYVLLIHGVGEVQWDWHSTVCIK